MELEHATIEIIKPAGEKFEVLFNPREYRLSKSNQFAEVGIPGLSAPPLQFGRGGARTLSMQLFFDTYTYHKSEDVQNYTEKVTSLLKVNEELHAPPICKFTWGKKLQFVGVLERAQQSFKLFLPDGTPVRATVDVSFKEFVEDQENRFSANYVKRYVVRRGDTLAGIAHQRYGNAAEWRPIAEVNGIDNPLQLVPGTVLVIPAIE